MPSQRFSSPYPGFLSLGILLALTPHFPLPSSPVLTLGIPIAQTCTTAQIDPLIAAFQDPWQQESAVRQLVNDCGQTAVPSLTHVLQTSPDPQTRQTVVIALGHIGGSAATQTLIAHLKADRDPSVRKTIADALGHIRDPIAIAPLTTLLNTPNEPPQVRQATAEALGAIGTADSVAPLLALLKNTREDLDLRHSAAIALSTIGEPAIPYLVTTLTASDSKPVTGPLLPYLK